MTSNRSGPRGFSRSGVKYVGIVCVATVLVPALFVLVSLAFTTVPLWLYDNWLIATLAVLLAASAGYWSARAIGTPRAAGWTALLICVSGSVIGWFTVRAFGV